MMTKFSISMLVGSALLLAQIAVVGTTAVVATTTSAFATSNPIPGVDIIVKKNPGGIIMQTTRTDANGSCMLGTLAPGEYTIECNGMSLGTAINKIDPNPEGPPHIIGVLIALLLPAVQKPIVSSEQPVRRGAAGQGISVGFTTGDVKGDGTARTTTKGGGPAAVNKYQYKGTVTLVK